MDNWNVLFSSLWDEGIGKCNTEISFPLPGQDIKQWVGLIIDRGYDEIDHMYIDSETKGG